MVIGTLRAEDVCENKYRETTALPSSLNDGIAHVDISNNAIGTTNHDSKINRICESLLSVLLTSKYQTKYLRAIITAYASQTPPNLNDALRLISGFSDNDEKEKSIEYLCFLQDVNLLYKTALGL